MKCFEVWKAHRPGWTVEDTANSDPDLLHVLDWPFDGVTMFEKGIIWSVERRVVDMEPPAPVLKPTPSKGLFDQFSAGAMGPSLTPVPDVDVYALYGYGLMKTLRNFNLPLGLAKVNS